MTEAVYGGKKIASQPSNFNTYIRRFVRFDTISTILILLLVKVQNIPGSSFGI